jgi:D-sedoheptulose 7-phosphate isomerase
MEIWDDYVAAVSAGLLNLAITDKTGTALAPASGFRRWIDLTRDVHAGGRHVFFIGNGASAGIASHIAADACKNGGLRARAFNDSALLTATANDLSFDQVFALPLSRFGGAGDMLISISSSGRSPNIVRALECARALGLCIVTLSGMDADNPSRRFGDLNLYVSSARYGWIECAHQVVLHYWLDQYSAASAHREIAP